MLKIKHQKKDPFVPPISISALFNLSCFLHNKNVAIDQNEFRITRKQIKHDKKILVRALLALGIKKGDIITVATGRPIYECILLFLSANQIGAIITFVDEKSTRTQILQFLEDYNSPLLVTYQKSAGKIKDLKKEAKSVKNVINLEDTTSIDGMKVGKISVFKIAERFKGHVPKNTFSANNPALITYTSGSTSGPKPVLFTNRSLVAGAIYNKTASGVKMWDKNIHTWMQFVKFNYPYGLWVSTMSPILGGGEVILTPDIDQTNFEYYFDKKPNTVFGVPALVDLLDKYLPKDTDMSSIKMFASGGERLDPEVAERIIGLLKEHGAKAVLCNGYGLAEVLGLVSTSVGQSYHPGTVGKIPAGVHVMVKDPETGEELGFNKTGELFVCGKHMLTEYYNRPETNAEKFIKVGGRRFLATGDVASVSPTGFVTLIGRSHFFINNIPAKVYYEFVRAAIIRSELVETCCVVKGPDTKYETAAYAYIVLKDGVPKNNDTRRAIAKTAAEIFQIGHTRIELKTYELPRKIIFMDELPKTKADKVDFRKLEKMARED